MKELGRKNLCYSLLLAAVMMMFLIGYFIWMLPSLYVSYAEEQNLEAIKKQHQVFMETGAYDEVYVKNPTACMSVKIPFEENYIEVASKIITLKISALDQEKETVELMKEIRSFVKKFQLKKTEQADGGGQESEQIFTDQQIRSEWNRLLKKIETIFTKVKLPVQTNVVYKQAEDGLFDRESFRIHAVSGHGIIVEATVFDQNNQYTNYLAVEQVSDGMVFSALPVIRPECANAWGCAFNTCTYFFSALFKWNCASGVSKAAGYQSEPAGRKRTAGDVFAGIFSSAENAGNGSSFIIGWYDRTDWEI